MTAAPPGPTAPESPAKATPKGPEPAAVGAAGQPKPGGAGYLVESAPEPPFPSSKAPPAGPASDSSLAPLVAPTADPSGGPKTGDKIRGRVDERPKAVQVATAHRPPRRARLVIKHIDPWTVMKVSFVVSLVMLVVCVVAVAVIYGVLGRMGVWDQINTLVNEVAPTTTSTALRNPLTASRVITVAAVVGGINVVLITALSTLGAAIYNLISDLVGGVEVTLTDP
jgi:hypothetical protein